MNKDNFIKGLENVFKDVGFDDIKAKNLAFRSHLMNILVSYIQHEELTQEQTAKQLKTTQPRVSNLLHGKIDLFSTNSLLNMLEAVS